MSKLNPPRHYVNPQAYGVDEWTNLPHPRPDHSRQCRASHHDGTIYHRAGECAEAGCRCICHRPDRHPEYCQCGEECPAKRWPTLKEAVLAQFGTMAAWGRVLGVSDYTARLWANDRDRTTTVEQEKLMAASLGLDIQVFWTWYRDHGGEEREG